jgi:hypothetical protein
VSAPKKDETIATPGTDLEAVAAQQRALAEQESVDAELFGDAGAGFEQADSDCYAIPFLKLLQALSPECNEAEGTALPGARPGMFYNTSTGELYDGDKGVFLLQCEFDRRFLRWRPKSDAGGGFMGAISVSEAEGMHTREAGPDEKPRGARFLDDGTYLNDTREHYCLVAPAPADGQQPTEWSMALISLSSTQIKKSKKIMAALRALRLTNAQGQSFNPPTYSRWIHAKRMPEKNGQGQSWWGWDFTISTPLKSRQALNEAKGFREAILSGAAKAANPDGDDAFVGETAGGGRTYNNPSQGSAPPYAQPYGEEGHPGDIPF